MSKITKRWIQGCFWIKMNIKHNEWILNNILLCIFLLWGVVQGTQKLIFSQAILFEMHNGKNMIHFRILPIGLRNAARASTRQQQRLQQVIVGKSLTRQQRTRHQKKHRGPQEAYIPYFMNQSSSADFRPLFDSVNISSFHVTQQTSTVSNKPDKMIVLGKG